MIWVTTNKHTLFSVLLQESHLISHRSHDSCWSRELFHCSVLCWESKRVHGAVERNHTKPAELITHLLHPQAPFAHYNIRESCARWQSTISDDTETRRRGRKKRFFRQESLVPGVESLVIMRRLSDQTMKNVTRMAWAVCRLFWHILPILQRIQFMWENEIVFFCSHHMNFLTCM